MADDLSTAAQTQHETPSSDAAASAASYISAGLAAAQLHITRATNRAGQDPAAPGGRDPIDAAREVYAPMMGRDRGRQASSSVALSAWQAALPFRDTYRDAAKASARAEVRLRTLHPDAMARFDALRAGLDPVQAMREVSPLIGREIANPAARAQFAPMLTATQGRDATSEQALDAWRAALPLREHIRDADVAASRAEDRLRTLHPEAMARYDALRGEHTPADAARQAALLVNPPPEAGAPVPAAAQPVNATAAPAGGQGGGPEPATVAPVQRFAVVVNEALPKDIAAAVLADKGWPKLAEALERAERRGVDPATVLASVSAKRETGTAKSPALVLAYRVEHHDEPAQRTPDTQDPATSPAAGTPVPAAATASVVSESGAVGAQPGAVAPVAAATTGSTAPDAATAAGVAAQSFPTPITQAPMPQQEPAAVDLGAAAAGASLAREGDVLADRGRDAATTSDDTSTPAVDEHHAGVVNAVPLDARSAADDARAGALLAQSSPPTSSTPATTSASTTGAAPEAATRASTSSGTPTTAPAAGSGAARAAAVAGQSFATPLNQASAPTAGAAPAAAAKAPPPTQTTTSRRR